MILKPCFQFRFLQNTSCQITVSINPAGSVDWKTNLLWEIVISSEILRNNWTKKLCFIPSKEQNIDFLTYCSSRFHFYTYWKSEKTSGFFDLSSGYIGLKWVKIQIKKTKVLPDQWRIQSLSDAGIPAWAPKLSAQIKGELMQNNISYLIMSSTQMRLHILWHLI